MDNYEKAIFGAGCFWCVEVRFRCIEGVKDVTVGYCGGTISYPTYRQVCSGLTGHAEVAQVIFDPKVVSYAQLLEAFFDMHDPTQINRQGPDIGTQYRSSLFPIGNEQLSTAKAALLALQQEKRFDDPVATTVEIATQFWPAEDYHQNYLAKKTSANAHTGHNGRL